VQKLNVLLVVMVGCGGGSSPEMPDANDVMIDAPIVTPDTPVGPPMIEVLAANEARPNSIAVFNGTVVWTTDPSSGSGQVRRLTAGSAVTLATTEDHPGSVAAGMGFSNVEAFWGTTSLLGQIRQIAITGQPPLSGTAVNDLVYALALDGDSVFAGTRSKVIKRNVANAATPMDLATGYGNGVLAIAADATGVVFAARTVQGTWVIATVPRSGGTVTTLATSTVDVAIRDIAIVGANVYWLDRTMVKKIARTGGTEAVVTSFGSSDRPWAMTVSQGKIYIATNQGVINPSGATGRIVELDPATGTVVEIAKDQAEPSGIAVDGSNIYWSNRGLGATQGQIVRIARK
jgi:hypothetical protein